ncbi:unnamed protein product [Adineta ricciae]|uniref:FERM domain-containing protein n=1 Tax=Adineta ricciae TaxID=249248 RepID=A0A813SCL4_ADIRI|nr:unnamed protein product [Adineta ricciae]CAF1034477.1 unnamed protein product [Adineta ricciae]
MAASRFIRFFSRRQPKTPNLTLTDDRIHPHSNGKILSNGKIHSTDKSQVTAPIKHGLVCTIIFLDGEEVNFEVDRKALGKNLYEKIIAHRKLVEPDYFGLQFIDTHNVKQWLDPTKSIKKQCKVGPPYTFRFRVKFYTSDPQNLRDELTRYLFVLQLKDDIRTGRLECPLGTDVELAALTMQAELGDYITAEHSITNVSEFHFLPDNIQTAEFEEQVLQKWMTYKGLTPADCEIQYLNKARWLEMYGVDLHTVMGKDNLEYKLGLTPTGILVFENKIKIGLFVWSKVTRIDFNRNKLTIVVVEDDDNDPRLQRDFVFLFRCHDEKQCKLFWKCALEYHIFFRTTSANKLKQGAKSNFTRMGSRFRFSGRTECQTTALGNLANSGTNFERKASHRFSRRASYAIRKKIQEQEILREQEDERLKRLKSEQEAKLSESKTQLNVSNHDLTSVSKRSSSISSSQKNLNLTAAQRLDNLILGTPNELFIEETETTSNSATTLSAHPPPVPPRQTKSEDKIPSPKLPVKQTTSSVITNNHVNTPKESSHEILSTNNNEDELLIQLSSQNPSTSHTNGQHQINPSRTSKMNSLPNRYTLANSQPMPYVVKQISSDDFNTNQTSSSKQNNYKFPLFVSPSSELSSANSSRASYDNILNYCLNPANESNSIYAKFSFQQRDSKPKTDEKQFEQRCANYDNLSYLVIDGITSKKFLHRGIGKISSCKDYFAATTGFIFNENGQRDETMTNNQQIPTSTTPVIVTRTLSQSNVRHASSTLVQATNPIQIPSRSPLLSHHSQFYHPLTTEL